MHELVRFTLNGLFATAVHFGVLSFNVEVLHFPSAGLANLVASVFGITSSFIGNRYFVFEAGRESAVAGQAARFGVLYGLNALIHGGVMALLVDYQGLHYRVGFVVATGIQFVLSYVGNKLLVFKHEA